MKKISKVVFSAMMMGLLVVPTACGNKSEVSKTSVVATAEGFKTMSGAELQAIEDDKDKKEKYLVIDVRSPEEYKAGHVKFAVNMPLDKFSDYLEEIKARGEEEIILYCNSGKKSGEAAKILVDNGFKNVYNADGVKQYEYPLVTYGNIFADELLNKKDEAFIVDVRESKDYDEAHFTNAVNVSVDDLKSLDDKLPQDKDALIITHCYSGNRSAKAAEYITGLGYTNVWNTVDGTKEVEFKFN